MSAPRKVGNVRGQVGNVRAVGVAVRPVGLRAPSARPALDLVVDVEQDAAGKLAALEASFPTPSPRRWVCLVFQSREQKEAFLDALGHDREESDKYLFGPPFARLVLNPRARSQARALLELRKRRKGQRRAVGAVGNVRKVATVKGRGKSQREVALEQMDRRKQNELDRYALEFNVEADSEFWLCVGWDAHREKESFLRAIGHDTGRSPDFASGTTLARKLGIELPVAPKWKPAPEPREQWAALAMPLARP